MADRTRSETTALPGIPPGVLPATGPGAQELAAYRDGRLDLARFELVDRWLAAQPPDVQERLLAPPGEPTPGTALVARDDAGAPRDEPHLPAPEALAGGGAPFTPEAAGPGRFARGEQLGIGGMGVVESAHDHVLGREVALKRCRPRRPDESMAAYAARLRTFKREAAITAQLEHPAIVPVHDVGSAALGEPAFLMKRLDGERLSALAEARAAGGELDLARTAEIVLRVAEAIAYAHRRDVVHRDLKPDNVIVGALGAVHVIDWGLAARTARAPGADDAGTSEIEALALMQSTASHYRVGTPGWMAPEQFGAAPADPRMDVFALGGLLMALLTGRGPRDVPLPDRTPGAAVNLAPLEGRGLPRGLVAVARRCLSLAPELRYPDGSAVADDLRRWLAAGITLAEKPSAAQRGLAWLRQHPRSAGLAAFALLAVLVAAGAAVLVRHLDREHIVARIAALDRAANFEKPEMEALRTARHEVEALLRGHPEIPEGRELHGRLGAAEEVLAAKLHLEARRKRLADLARTYAQKGPWATEVDDVAEVLRDCGYLHGLAADTERLRTDPLRPQVLPALVQLERSWLVNDIQAPQLHDLPRLIMDAAPNRAWRALGAVLANATVSDYDLMISHGPDADLALDQADTADLLLATCSPETRLVKVAQERWHEDAGAFWPRIVSARDALEKADWDMAERHALVALGAESDSLWPHLVLAYVALADHDDQALLREADYALDANSDNIEVLVLKAVALAHLGKRDQAQFLLDQRQEYGLIQYHLHNPGMHPMERSVHALRDAGVTIPEVPPLRSPVVRPKHR